MRGNRKIVIIAEDKELFNAFHRAFASIDDGDVTWVNSENNLQNYIKNGTPNVILLHSKSRNEKYRWLWERIIIGLHCNIPIIATGYHKINKSEDLRDIFFEKFENVKSYRYFQIPFLFKELNNAISEVKPFINLSSLAETFCNWDGILYNILTHDIPNRLNSGSKEEAIAYYKKIKETLLFLDKEQEIISMCNSAIKEIKTQDLYKGLSKVTSTAYKIAEKLNR